MLIGPAQSTTALWKDQSRVLHYTPNRTVKALRALRLGNTAKPSWRFSFLTSKQTAYAGFENLWSITSWAPSAAPTTATRCLPKDQDRSRCLAIASERLAARTITTYKLVQWLSSWEQFEVAPKTGTHFNMNVLLHKGRNASCKIPHP